MRSMPKLKTLVLHAAAKTNGPFVSGNGCPHLSDLLSLVDGLSRTSLEPNLLPVAAKSIADRMQTKADYRNPSSSVGNV